MDAGLVRAAVGGRAAGHEDTYLSVTVTSEGDDGDRELVVQRADALAVQVAGLL